MKINREVEREADVLDQASQTSELFIEAGIAASVDACAPETHPDFDGKTCVECGDDIPDGRLALMRVRCVRCQERVERRARSFSRG
jgi:RNA polymerase-binding transcription factor DksA